MQQALVVIYSAIDTLAWADRESGDVQKTDFIGWSDKYMEPLARLGCSGTDLYAARCALLHSGTAESKMSREGRAVPIWYVSGNASKAFVENRIASENLGAKVLSAEELLNAFLDAARAFDREIDGDTRRRGQVVERLRTWLGIIPADANGLPNI